MLLSHKQSPPVPEASGITDFPRVPQESSAARLIHSLQTAWVLLPRACVWGSDASMELPPTSAVSTGDQPLPVQVRA